MVAPPRRSDSDLSKANLQYDSSSGQVYSEAVIAAKSGRSRKDSLSGAILLPRLGKVRERLNYSGSAPSLETLAIHAVFENIESLTVESLEYVPWPIKKRLWDNSKATLTTDQRFHLWKLLVQNGHRDSRLTYRRLSKENLRDEPLLPLPHYLPAINSPTSAWLTALTISKLNIPRSHLYQLAKIPNLVALDICAPPDHEIAHGEQPSVDNHVLKHFAAHAECAGAFQALRVLILREFRSVTKECMQHLNSFLRLSLFGVQNCGIGQTSFTLHADERYAREYGWTTEDERGLLKQLRHEIDMKRTWDGMLRACVEMTAAFEPPSARDSNRRGANLSRSGANRWDSIVSHGISVPLTLGSITQRAQSLDTGAPLRNALRSADDRQSDQDVQPKADPPLLNFKVGPTCSGLIFPTPTVFFRCIHGHIQEQHQTTATNGFAIRRSESKNRRPSGPHDPPPMKRPKLKAGRKVEINSFLEMEGVGRSLSCVELNNGKRAR